ncbi:MAG: endo-1,4-beta-xylanase [Chloroflexi bacterium]|nr:endo-1,4-beta-xylanase [Chloroflexota bacterium]
MRLAGPPKRDSSRSGLEDPPLKFHETRANLAPFGTGGFTDAYSWYSMIGHPNAGAMLFDTAMAPKPAYFAVRDVYVAAAGE